MTTERREKEIKRLNETYLEVVAERKCLKKSLEHMVDSESYRWICRATYSLSPKAVRSQRNFEMDSEPTFVQDSVIFFYFLTKKNVLIPLSNTIRWT